MLKFLKGHIWVLVIILSFLMIPQSLSTQAQLKMRVLVTGLAIDKVSDGEYLLTAQVIMPSASTDGSGVAKINLVSAKSETVAKCINKVAFSIGKTVGLSHISYVLLGNSFDGEYLPTVLDFFLRNRYINNSLVVMLTDGNASEEIKKTKYFELGTGISLQTQFIYKQSSGNGLMIPIQEFLNGIYTKSSSGMLSYVKIYEEESLANESSGKSTNSQSSNKELMGRFVYDNKIGYFTRGKIVGVFEDKDVLNGVMLLNKKSKKIHLTVANVNDDVYKNATVNFFVRNKKVDLNAKFKEGKPLIKIKVNLGVVEFSEIKETEGSLKNFDAFTNFLSPAFKDRIKEKVTNDIMLAINQAKSDNCDAFGFKNMLFRSDLKNYNKYKKENGEEAIFQDCNIEIDVSIKKIS